MDTTVPTFTWDSGINEEGHLMDLHTTVKECGCIITYTDTYEVISIQTCTSHS